MKQRNTYKYQRRRALERKLHLINLRGGKCERCTYNKNIAVLEFHHIDRKEKKHSLDARFLSNNTMKIILEEFAKCEVLCSNCHRENHNPNCNIELIKKQITNYKNSTSIIVRTISKPKCSDCGKEINYTYIRCRKCKNISTRKPRPDIQILIEESKKFGYAWCGRKYNVTDTSIKRWIKEFLLTDVSPQAYTL